MLAVEQGRGAEAVSRDGRVKAAAGVGRIITRRLRYGRQHGGLRQGQALGVGLEVVTSRRFDAILDPSVGSDVEITGQDITFGIFALQLDGQD